MARVGQALRIKTAGMPAALIMSTTLLIAARSKAVGLHGTTARSTALAILDACGAAWGAVSMIARVIPSLLAASNTLSISSGVTVATIGLSFSLVLLHTVADCCGSVSINATFSPSSWAATA